jgi:hypothetical protein
MESPMIKTWGRPSTSSMGAIGFARLGFWVWAFVKQATNKKRMAMWRKGFFIS